MATFRVKLGGVEDNQVAIEACYPGDSVRVYGSRSDPRYWLVRDDRDNDLGTLPRRGKLIDEVLSGGHMWDATVHSIDDPTEAKPFFGLSIEIEVRSAQEQAIYQAATEKVDHIIATGHDRATSYKVGIVGESNYQPAIKAARRGEAVTILRELGNPYDSDALVVRCARNKTIGYVARDSWLREAILDEGKGCTASIVSIERNGAPHLGVVLDVTLNNDALAECRYSARGTSPVLKGVADAVPYQSFLSKLFGRS